MQVPESGTLEHYGKPLKEVFGGHLGDRKCPSHGGQDTGRVGCPWPEPLRTGLCPPSSLFKPTESPQELNTDRVESLPANTYHIHFSLPG